MAAPHPRALMAYSANISGGLPRAVAAGAIHDIHTHAAHSRVPRYVVMCQEAKHHGDLLGGQRVVLDPNGELPIWTNMEIVGKRADRAYPDTKVGSWGAGPSMMLAGWDTMIVTEPFPDERLGVIDLHAVPSVTRSGDDKAARDGRAARDALSELEFEQVAKMAGDLEHVIIGGDTNLPPGHENFAPLLDAGFVAVEPGISHHPSSRIDRFFVRGITVTNKGTLGNFLKRSNGELDHRPVFMRGRLD